MHALLLSLLITASPLVEAKKHLEAGKLDDVLFDLDGQKFAPEEAADVSALLSRASTAALKKKDDVLALQFAQMALKSAPGSEVALEAAARAALGSHQFESAEGYADRWIAAAPKSTAAKVLRAQLHAEAAEWPKVVSTLEGLKLAPPEVAVAAKLTERATTALKEKDASRSELKSLEIALVKAQEAAAAGSSETRPAPRSSNTVVVYSTTWCGYCKKAKAWLKKKGVDFVERDIEKDEGAAAELAEKATRAGVKPSGVPVIDAKGTLILGYDEAAMERAL